MNEKDKLKELLRDTWMMLWNVSIDFSNGVTHQGMDEGKVRGWKMYKDLEDRLFDLLGEEYLGTKR